MSLAERKSIDRGSVTRTTECVPRGSCRGRVWVPCPQSWQTMSVSFGINIPLAKCDSRPTHSISVWRSTKNTASTSNKEGDARRDAPGGTFWGLFKVTLFLSWVLILDVICAWQAALRQNHCQMDGVLSTIWISRWVSFSRLLPWCSCDPFWNFSLHSACANRQLKNPNVKSLVC